MGVRSNGGFRAVVARGVRMLALVTDAFGGYGGIAQYNCDLFQALAASRFVRDIFVLPRIGRVHGTTPDKLTQIEPRRGRLSYSLTALTTARKVGDFDLVFCGHLYHIPLAASLGRLFGLPVWLQAHGIDAWDCPSRLVRAAIGRTALVTTVSRYTRGRLLGWTNLSPDRVRVLPNTVRPIFTPGPVSETAIAKFGLIGAKIILTVSRINKSDAYKGHGRVIESIAAVREAEPRAVYVVVGEGDARAELEAMADRRGVGGSVRFLGRLSDDDVVALYRSAEVFAMPSTGEGFGIAFVEAAATGLSVIAGNRDGSVDALADGAIGRLIDPLSSDEMVTALIDGLRGRRQSSFHAVQRFSFPNFAAHVDALVQDFVR
jgi:phosphatidyl-myo-inositol dimannoside synthase